MRPRRRLLPPVPPARTTSQVPEHMWPADRAAFEDYWAAALAELRIDPPVRDYLNRLITLTYLPRPFGTALGPLNRFLTTGFLPPPFREQMQLPWTERDQELFDFLIELVAAVNRLLPAPVSRFPFNASLHELRLQMIRNRLLSGWWRIATRAAADPADSQRMHRRGRAAPVRYALGDPTLAEVLVGGESSCRCTLSLWAATSPKLLS